MLHVICLNPAIDKIYRISDFAAGEDYPGQKPEVRVGGKGVNVARVLSQLGAPVHLYGFLGEGGDIIRSQTYEAFLPLIAVALIYLAMVMIFTKLVSLLERRLRNSER